MGNFFAGVGFGMLLLTMILTVSSEHSVIYKQGQVDALTGKVKFHLVENPDGTKEWKRKQENNNVN